MGRMRKAREEVSKGSISRRPYEAVRVSDLERRTVRPPHVAWWAPTKPTLTRETGENNSKQDSGAYCWRRDC